MNIYTDSQESLQMQNEQYVIEMIPPYMEIKWPCCWGQ